MGSRALSNRQKKLILWLSPLEVFLHPLELCESIRETAASVIDDVIGFSCSQVGQNKGLLKPGGQQLERPVKGPGLGFEPSFDLRRKTQNSPLNRSSHVSRGIGSKN
jgi:hypothetical protein